MAIIQIPSFEWSGFYYPDILEALVQFKRLNVPELTDESPQEPFMQLLRAFALVGHLNNVNADMVANESTLPTAQLVQTVRNMLRLIDFEMRSASPAQADVIYELASVFTTTTALIPENALVETIAQDANEDVRPFEALEALNVTRTDRFTAVLTENQYVDSGTSNLSSVDGGLTVTLGSGTFDISIAAGDKIRLRSGTTGFPYRTALVEERTSDTELALASVGLRNDFTNLSWEVIRSGIYTDVTTDVNDVSGGTETTPWPTNIMVKDALYLGHAEAMWDTIDVTLDTPGSGITGVWEYYDGTIRQTKPDLVTNLGSGQLKFNLNSLLGTEDRKGTEVRVQFDDTTAFEFADSEWDGTNNFIVTSVLGQGSPSTDFTTYTVGSTWHQLTDVTDDTADFTTSDVITYTLPQTLTQDWTTIDLNSTEAFYLRYRIVATVVPSSPVIDLIRMDTGKQFVKRNVTQGRTQIDSPLGSSDGTANQRFTATRTFFIARSSTLTVDGVEWTQVDNFLASKPTDRHYTVELDTDDTAIFVFGDSVAGAIPPSGIGNIIVTYRYNAEIDGNVGANTISSDKTGLRFINRLYNPRPAFGWREADGATATSLARVKLEGPASLRVKTIALNGDDAAVLATQYIDSAGARPVARARGIEEGFGPKTVELVVVGAGGTDISDAVRDELDIFFNGDDLASPPKPKHFVANQEITTVNFAQRVILVTATVTVIKNSTLTGQNIKDKMLEKFQPLTLRDDATYEWEFGEDVPENRIIHEIFATSSDVLDVVLAAPTSNTALTIRELPVLDPASTFTIVISS